MSNKKEAWNDFAHVVGNALQVVESLTGQINQRVKAIERAFKALREKITDDDPD